MPAFEGLIELSTQKSAATALKQAVLIFDHVKYIAPYGFRATDGLLARIKDGQGEKSVIQEVSWFEDIEVWGGLANESLRPDELRECVSVFVNAGVISPAAFEKTRVWFDESYLLKVRKAIGEADLYDARYVKFARKYMSRPDTILPTKEVVAHSESGKEFKFTLVDPPVAVSTSWALTNLAYLSTYTDASPLSLHDVSSYLLETRFARMAKQAANKRQATPLITSMEESIRGLPSKIAMIELLAPSKIVEDMSAHDVISARKANDARVDLLSRYMVETQELLNERDGKVTAASVRDFYHGKLRPALEAYKNEQDDFRTRWFGKASSVTAEVAAAGSSGVLVATPLPIGGLMGASLGASLWALKRSPGLIKEITDLFIERRSSRRSGMAYMMAIRSR